MRKALSLLVLVMCIFCASNVVLASQEIVIGPYGNRETAVEGDIRFQLERAREALKEVKIGYFERLDITIEGSANQTGLKAENAAYSKDRANAAEGFLKSEFPEAQFAVIPAGSEHNAREVRVSWQTRSMLGKRMIASSAFAIAISVMILIVLIKLSTQKNVVIVEKRYGNAVNVRYEGSWYSFLPLLNSEGVSQSLHTEVRDGQVYIPAFKNPKYLADSVEKSLKTDPSLIDELVKENRWKFVGPLSSKGATP